MREVFWWNSNTTWWLHKRGPLNIIIIFERSSIFFQWVNPASKAWQTWRDQLLSLPISSSAWQRAQSRWEKHISDRWHVKWPHTSIYMYMYVCMSPQARARARVDYTMCVCAGGRRERGGRKRDWCMGYVL